MKIREVLVFAIWFVMVGLPRTADAQLLSSFHVIPQIADGDGYVSIFFVTKADSANARCTLNLIGMSNTRLLETTFSVPVNLSGYVTSTTGTAPLATGFATLSCTSQVWVNTIFTLSKPSEGVISWATVFSSGSFSRASFIALQDPPQVRLGIALANNSSSTVTCQISVNISGTLYGKDITLPPQGHIAKFVDELLPQLPSGFQVLLVFVTSSQPVYGIGLLYDGLAFTTIPPSIYF